MTGWRIVCDVGGTNVRYARSTAPGCLSDVVAVPLGSEVSLSTALNIYAARFRDRDALQAIVIAAAGAVEGGRARLTNRDLIADADQIEKACAVPSVLLLNDLEAVAWSLPVLGDADTRRLVVPKAPLSGPRLVINVGTGFGGAMLVAVRGGYHAIACEPGHMTLSAPVAANRRVSIEDAISGPSLTESKRLSAIWSLPDDAAKQAAASGDVFATSENSNAGRAFLARFSAGMGRVVGDLVLATGAWGGVFFCGSAATAWCRHADHDAFRAAFIDKGPMSARMSRVAVSEITAAYPGLVGLSAA